MLGLLPPTAFFQVLAGIEDSCDLEWSARLVEEILSNLDGSGISIYSQDALAFIPTVVFGGAFSRGDKFVVSTGELLTELTETELALARHHLSVCAERLATNQGLDQTLRSGLSSSRRWEDSLASWGLCVLSGGQSPAQ
jgi:hypothetical protein